LDRAIRILIAEEDPLFAKMIEDSLRESGGTYLVEKVFSGEECFKKLSDGKYDILLLDYAFSDGEGLDWLRKFNQ